MKYNLKYYLLAIFFLYFFNGTNAQVGTLRGTGMSICNVYNFSICPTQTITPFNYGSQNYSCNNTTLPDVSFNIMGSGWRVEKQGWSFSATVGGQLSGYNSSGILQTIPFLASNTITPLSYSGTFVQFAINGVSTGSLLSQDNFSISLNPVVFGGNSYTYCVNTATSIAISPTVPAVGGPWTYNWQPGSLSGNPANVSPTVNSIYTVTANSIAGCASIATVAVNINCSITQTVPTAFFTSPDTICVNQSFSIVNTSSVSSTYYWNFCSGNVNTTPQATNLGNIGGIFNGPVFSTIEKEGSNYYVFITNNSTGTLSRLFYGTSLLNTPVATNLGSLGGVLPGNLEDIHIENIGGTWYGITVGGFSGGERIIRINFGNSLANTPVATNMGNIGSLNYPQRLQIFKSGTTYYGFTVNRNGHTITRFDFGNSLANTPTGINLGNVGQLNIPDAISLINFNNNWYGYIINEGNNTVTRLDFNNSLLNIPTGTNLGNPGGLNGPRGLSIFTDCNNISGLITNRFSNTLVTLNFPTGPTGPISTNVVGNIGNLSFPHSIERFRIGDTLYAYITNVSNNTLTRIFYPGCSNASIPSSTLQTPPLISYNTPGVYNISLVTDETLMTQSNYCKQVTVIGPPTPTITSVNNVCGGDSIKLFGLAPSGCTFLWNGPNSFVSTNQNIIIPNANASNVGTYTLTINKNGCISSPVIKTIILTASPQISISSIPASLIICNGAIATLTATGATSYTWSPSGSLSSFTNSIVSVNPTITTTYTVSGSIGTCTNVAVCSVTVTPNPTITIIPTLSSICSGQTTTLTANGANSYSWTNSASLSGSTGSIVIASPQVTTTYTVTGIVGSCINSAIVTVSVVSQPVITINSSTTSICLGASLTLTANGAPSYTWSPNVTAANTATNIVDVSPSINTTYTVVGGIGTCTNTTMVTINVFQNPPISVSDKTICAGTTETLIVTGAATYSWSPSLGLNAITGQTVIASLLSTQMYTVIGTFTNGCIGNASALVTVINNPTISVSASSVIICSGQSSSLTALGASSYTWSPVMSLTNVNASQTIATPLTTETYVVVGSNGVGPNFCSSTQSIEIQVLEKIIPSVSPSTSFCLGSSTTLYASGGTIYSWNPTINVIKPNDSVTIVKPIISTIYTVTVSRNGLCPSTSSATVEVVVNALPIVNAGNDTIINIGEYITLQGTGNADVGFLSPSGVPLSCNFCPTITVNPYNTTCYTLMGANQYYCYNFDEVCVSVLKDWDVYIPNTFTPNGDLKNEYFIPLGYGIEKINVVIFDRWGLQVFKEENTTLGWDGKKNGRLCEQGIYVYQVEIFTLAGQVFNRTGHVNLLPRAN